MRLGPCTKILARMFQSDLAYASKVEEKLKSFNLSPAAAHFVTKALHPVVGAATQIPDAIQVSSLAPEYKTNTVITSPPGLATPNWDLCIVVPPSDTISAMYTSGNQGTDFSSTVGLSTQVIRNTGAGVTTNSCLRGTAARLDGTFPIDIHGDVTYSVEDPVMWRTVARSATVYATGSDLYNQGTVYAAQYARTPLPAVAKAVVGAGGDWIFYNVDHVDLPLNEVDMAVMTPGMYTAAAREGVYTVHRLAGPAQNYARARMPVNFAAPDPVVPALYGTVYSEPTSYSPQAQHFVRFLESASTVVTPAFPADPTVGQTPNWASTGFDAHCTWGVIIMRGLHPNMSVTLKVVTNLEIVPSSDAPTRQFVRPALKYEPTAMAAYYALASEVPDCMASKYNFLGALLPMISSIASKVLPVLAPALGSLFGGSRPREPPPPPPRDPAPPVPTPIIRMPKPPTTPRRRATSRSSAGSSRVRVKVARKRRNRA